MGNDASSATGESGSQLIKVQSVFSVQPKVPVSQTSSIPPVSLKADSVLLGNNAKIASRNGGSSTFISLECFREAASRCGFVAMIGDLKQSTQTSKKGQDSDSSEDQHDGAKGKCRDSFARLGSLPDGVGAVSYNRGVSTTHEDVEPSLSLQVEKDSCDSVKEKTSVAAPSTTTSSLSMSILILPSSHLPLSPTVSAISKTIVSLYSHYQYHCRGGSQ